MRNNNNTDDVKVVLKWIAFSWLIVLLIGLALGAGLYAITLASCGG